MAVRENRSVTLPRPLRTVFALTAALVAGAAAGAPRLQAPGLRFSQRLEVKRSLPGLGRDGGMQEETIGRFTIEGALAVDSSRPIVFDPDTRFALRLGGFEVSERLGSDPDYRPGRRRARLASGARKSRGGRSSIVRLEWDRKALRIRIEGDGEASRRLLGEALPEKDGSIGGEVTAFIRFAETGADFIVPYLGEVTRRRKLRSGGMQETVRLEVRGTGRTRSEAEARLGRARA